MLVQPHAHSYGVSVFYLAFCVVAEWLYEWVWKRDSKFDPDQRPPFFKCNNYTSKNIFDFYNFNFE